MPFYALDIDSKPVTIPEETHDETESTVTVTLPGSDRDGDNPETEPLDWCNWAAVNVDAEKDAVTLLISTDDPNGAFAFTVHRVNDPEHENHGRLVLTMPYAEGSGLHEPLRQIAAGGYVVGREHRS